MFSDLGNSFGVPTRISWAVLNEEEIVHQKGKTHRTITATHWLTSKPNRIVRRGITFARALTPAILFPLDVALQAQEPKHDEREENLNHPEQERHRRRVANPEIPDLERR